MNRLNIVCFSETKPAAPVCGECGGEILPGESYYDVGGELVCRECLEFYARRLLHRCRRRRPETGEAVRV